MSESPTTRALYPQIPVERMATAACYHCGTQQRAKYLIWMNHSLLGAYLALCGPCYASHNADYLPHGSSQ